VWQEVSPVCPATADLKLYNYSVSDSPSDSNGHSVVKRSLSAADLATGVTVDMPARGVVFATTAADR
jgi:hypothetical protein